MKSNELKEQLDRIENLLGNQSSRPMSVEQAAQFVGVSRSYLYRLSSQAQIPHFKSKGGKRVFFLEEDLRAWMLANRVSTNEELLEAAIRHDVA